MNIDSLITKVLPTMLQAWISLAIFIVFVLSMNRFGSFLYLSLIHISEPTRPY